MSNSQPQQLKTLLVEDNEGDAFLIKEGLACSQEIQFALTYVNRLSKAIELLQTDFFNIILLDLNLPDSQGLETFFAIEKIVPHLPIIILSGLNDESLALQAVREGAQDYLVKGQTSTEVLIRSMNYAIERMHHLEKIHQSEVSLQQVNQELTQQVENHISEIEHRDLVVKKLFLLAKIDKVTGIANRHHLEDFLQREWNNAIRNQLSISIIMIDIDFFKLYNDTYGHQAGDLCLRQVSQAIKNTIKRPKDLVARYGGEEFIVILSDINLDGTMMVAENIRSEIKALSIPHQTSKMSNYLTVSLGVSQSIPQLNSSASSLIVAADKALYLAKEKGRDQVEMYQI